MTTKERILEEARSLSESESRALLDFIGFLKYKRAQSANQSETVARQSGENAAKDMQNAQVFEGRGRVVNPSISHE